MLAHMLSRMLRAARMTLSTEQASWLALRVQGHTSAHSGAGGVPGCTGAHQAERVAGGAARMHT